LSSLKEEDVQQLARIIESLEQSAFDYLQLQVGDMKVTIGKGNIPVAGAPAFAAPAAPAYVPPPAAAQPAPAQPAPAAPSPAAQSRRSPAAGPTPAGMVDIKSEIMGMFYAQPEPGAPAFVTIGAEVKEDTTICLIEVMKTFNAIPAGVRGVITEICVENAQLVEYGQVLFRVRPS
jgi:acetyl-CoA carboxylase biotin carboxyl carrier protein